MKSKIQRSDSDPSLLIVTALNLLLYVLSLTSFFFSYNLAILKACCQTPFHSLVFNISIKLSESPCGTLFLNITFMLSFFQKSNNDPCNCVTNFFQNLSLPNAHTKCYTVSGWEALYSAKFTLLFILQIAKNTDTCFHHQNGSLVAMVWSLLVLTAPLWSLYS